MSSLTLSTLVLISPGVCIQDFLFTVFMMFMSHSIHPVKKKKNSACETCDQLTIPSLLQLMTEDLQTYQLTRFRRETHAFGSHLTLSRLTSPFSRILLASYSALYNSERRRSPNVIFDESANIYGLRDRSTVA